MKRSELSRMKKEELLKLAKSKNLKVAPSMNRPDLIELISKAEATGPAARKEPAAPAGPRAAKRKPAAARKRAVSKAAPKKPSGTKSAERRFAPRPPAFSRPLKREASKEAARGKGPTPPPARSAASAKPRAAKAGPAAPAKPAAPAGLTSEKKRPAEPHAPGRERRAPKAKPRAPKAEQPAPRRRPVEGTTIRQQAVASKYYLGTEERPMPPVESMEVPGGYGIDRIVAMVRDPYWIFTYWEVTPEQYRDLERRFGGDWPRCTMILRVSDVDAEPRTHFDITLTMEARNWYINVQPERSYQVAIGAVGPDGRFVEVAVSNVVKTPRMGVSDVVDDRWLIPDELFQKIFAASGGYGIHKGSLELRELLERRLLEEISSGAVSSFGSGAIREEQRGRGFRLWVATELILYGATDPDARVTVQGKDIELRGDGTFSLRFALPEGKIDIPVKAVSADEVEERRIETSVHKTSEEKEPVIR